jgi:Zn-dependent M28 family amino/carboxypeptidase
MCKERLKHYPIPDKTMTVYVKPVASKLRKIVIDKKVEASLSEVSTDFIKSKLLKLSSFHTRHTKSKYINEVAQWLRNEFESMGYDNVFYHEYNENIDGTEYDLKNVICNKKGTNNKWVLICAHYDSRMERLNDHTSKSPGANDNASGVSAILEIARLLRKLDLEYGVQFALFSGEEQGLLGSKHYSKFVKENKLDVYRLINLDMIGYPQLNLGIVLVEKDDHTDPAHNQVNENDESSIEFAKIMADMSSYTDLKVSLNSIWNSDYEPFEAEGYVVVGAYDGSADENQNPHYHNTTDIPSLIDWSYLTSVTKLVMATTLTVTKMH